MSITSYIQQARVERSKFLLANTNQSVSKIALDLQFSSSSHFSNVFQSITGIKPQQYRKKEQKI